MQLTVSFLLMCCSPSPGFESEPTAAVAPVMYSAQYHIHTHGLFRGIQVGVRAYTQQSLERLNSRSYTPSVSVLKERKAITKYKHRLVGAEEMCSAVDTVNLWLSLAPFTSLHFFYHRKKRFV